MIKLRVQWPNPGHALLANPAISLKGDDAPLSPTGEGLGFRDFEIPDGAATAELSASFTAILPQNDVPDTVECEVLAMVQHYAVDGDALTPDQATMINPRGIDLTRQVHPLVQTVSAANAGSGAALIELRTEFVDITKQWALNASMSDELLRQADTEPESRFVAIAATGSSPPLWFAHFRDGLQPPDPATGAMVFFRPHGHYTYVNAFDVAHRRRGAQDLNRYLLAPKDSGLFVRDEDTPPYKEETRQPFINDYYPLRVGWQQAVLRSGKPVVVFHPWPTSGLNFGDALTSRLPTLLEQMLRFLQGTGRMGGNQPALTLGRLGLSGYSAGGVPAMDALRANRRLVKELYLFDPFPFAAHAPFAADWALKTQDFRLRMTGANFWGQLQALRLAVIAGVSGEAGDAFVTLKPASPTFYLPEAKGGGHYWSYVTHTHPEMRGDFNVQHQFAIFGGDQVEVGEDENMISNVTWLEEFLTNSGY